MKKKAVILGGSKGLGLELAKETIARNIQPIVLGRSAPNIPDYHHDVSYKVNLADSTSVGGCAARVGAWWDEDTLYFVWNAGVLEVAPVDKINDPRGLIRTNLDSAVRIIESLVAFAKFLKRPIHLVTISSTSSWKARKYQAHYCLTKAGQAAFSRALALELRDDLPWSRVTLVKPAGMKTKLFDEVEGTDITEFMDPQDVARVVWDEVLNQRNFFKEFQVDRKDGKPIIVRRNFAPILFE